MLFRLGLTEAEVEDTVQDALLKVWQGSAGFEGRSAVSTWACRIALDRGLSVLRARRVDPRWQPVAVVDTEAAWESRRQAEAVREAIMGLPVPLRAVIVQREFEGFPLQEHRADPGHPDRHRDVPPARGESQAAPPPGLTSGSTLPTHCELQDLTETTASYIFVPEALIEGAEPDLPQPQLRRPHRPQGTSGPAVGTIPSGRAGSRRSGEWH